VRSVCLMDTSVFCNYLKLPGRDQNRDDVLGKITAYIQDRTALLLPVASVIETGNHIAHVPDGNLRRRTAERFVKAVQDAIDHKAPWIPIPVLEVEALRQWLEDFPDCASRGEGLGDLTIIKEFDRQCQLNQGRRVFIWSLDGHLSCYDRPAASI